jgi:hypothetical protein
MTWDVLQHTDGSLQLIVTGDPVPDDWTVVAVTCNPDYIDYMISIME